MMINRKFLTIMFCVMISTILNLNVYAATGNQGYAVYRNGVKVGPFNVNWHASLMDDPHYNSTSQPVIEADGTNNVKFSTWAQFVRPDLGNSYQGVYRPKVQPSSTDRDNFDAMARRLVTESIPYCLGNQLSYSWALTGHTWVYASDIGAIRCDGVIEYCYEFYGFKVFGSTANWDISKWGYSSFDAHSIVWIQPKAQAESYLTKIVSAPTLP